MLRAVGTPENFTLNRINPIKTVESNYFPTPLCV